MQQIYIQRLKVPTLIGVYDWERTQVTTLIVDVVLYADLTQAMFSDDVQHTINYAEVADCIKRIGESSSFELLEALANAIIQALIGEFPVTRIELSIEKPGILPDADKVGICVKQDVVA